MRTGKKTFFRLLIMSGMVVSLALGGVAATLAQQVSYDRYAARYEKTPVPESSFKSALLHFPTLPFQMLKWPTDKALMYIEHNHIDKKVIWIYDKLKARGLTPHLNVINPSRLSFGADFDFVRLLKQKHHYPDLMIHGGVHFSPQYIFNAEGVAGWERIADSGLSFLTEIQYEDRMREHFYGIGPDSSRGEGSVYGWEMTRVEPILRYELGPFYRADLSVSYRNINISGGKDGGRGQVGDGPAFARGRIAGIDGDSLGLIGLELLHDTRNQKENSTQGGYQRFKMSFNEGLSGSPARFWKYEAELAHYVTLGTERRVLAFHFYGEHNDAMGADKVIPFHQMARVGGYGASPRLSHPLRAFDFNRFTDDTALLFNLEYRYTISQYRHFALDSVFFFEEGQVFGEFSEFQFRDFRESYGLGFRLNIANIPLLSIEVAHGDEGTNFYVKSKAPF